MDYLISVLIIAGIHIIMALSFYLPLMTGQISLGQAGFMSIGAYGSAVCTAKMGVPYVLAVLIGGICAGVVGFLLGLPALRIKGIYLLLLTLGFGEIVRVVFINVEYIGAAAGFPGIPYQEYTLEYTYGMVLVLIIFFNRLRGSRMGRAFHAVGSDEDAAEVIGVNIVSAKLMAFAAGAFIAGIGGGIFAHYQEYIEPLMFDVILAVEFIVFTIFGGIQIFWGPIFGAFVLTLTPEFLRVIQEWRMELYGALLIIMMIIRPQGVIGLDTVRGIKRIFGRSLGGDKA
ncbi:MAG: branched-chain amino acid ABC transporter permease [Deltaproteobacteria bacterium]|nr:branched-chain amino acid ABC transporter permease [Deltaproteobacteria bacterium]MCZ6622557.1 branched-chain amino acid ABC transporter permease [Deltaproteobacteria bacterium]MCZ6907281.1 branched-chain amino acid ABC transporter permease [Deltaproteobacteria bacterium]